MNEKNCPGYGSTFWFCRGTYLPKIWASCPPLAKALLNERLHIQHHKCNSNNKHSKSLQLMQWCCSTRFSGSRTIRATIFKHISYVYTICMLIQQECFGKGIINKCIKIKISLQAACAKRILQCKNCAASAQKNTLFCYCINLCLSQFQLGTSPREIFLSERIPATRAIFFSNSLPPGQKNDSLIPGAGAKVSQTRRNCSLSLKEILKKLRKLRDSTIFLFGELNKTFIF